jgi:hypothetical protein
MLENKLAVVTGASGGALAGPRRAALDEGWIVPSEEPATSAEDPSPSELDRTRER